MEDAGITKDALRREARAVRRAVTDEARAEASARIAERVVALPEIERAEAVLLYGATPEEVDTLPLERALRERGARIAYPRVVSEHDLQLHWVDADDELTTGSFGLREPVPAASCALPAEIDAIVVPGLAFDAEGGRLGYGRGYYDRLLAGTCAGVPTIGLAYDEQLVAKVPCDAHDTRLNVVVTPTRSIRCATSRP